MFHIAQKDGFASYSPHFTSPPNTVIILMTFYPFSDDTETVIVPVD